MKDLLELALDRWNKTTRLVADTSATGSVFHLKGWPDVFKTVEVSLNTHGQRVSYSPFVQSDHQSVYEPERTSIISVNRPLLDRVASAIDFHHTEVI